ncbi:MAG: amidohydrolase family protein [Lentimicrobium sp.]|uniref:amidohydrolase family protein n=1 Tax=Lentimicrobium sp. TaxID=2034841 RepID=UPI0025D5A0BE|nr:amidohydrolase family protein [Lentimicrobium sp.]MCO5257355.1 amidohydrolase family protein [Lentimicrobium sp.]
MNNKFEIISDQVNQIELIDTHEHLIDESERLDCLKPFIQCDDWTTIFGLYTKFDFVSSGMPQKDIELILSQEILPLEKWKIIEPFWQRIKFTGYGQVIQHTINDLYDISELQEKSIPELQEKYISYRKKGFYKETLKRANIKCCVVNPPGRPFKETELPKLFLQDIDAMGMIRMDFEKLNENIVPEISELNDWLEIINWWFDKYADNAVGVKIGIAYFRRLDFNKTTIEIANPLFSKKVKGEKLSKTEEKTLQDYLFWYVVDLATKNRLPIKFHTGHQAMNNFMNLENVMFNPADCANLCRLSPDTKFIFFHISYPYYEPMILLTKHYSNAIVDMCWSWTINPIASIDFLKKYIMTSPINKIMAFGGDDLYIENLVGHAKLARKGISKTLSELVQDNWISEQDSNEIAKLIMWKNAKKIYEID